MRGVLLFATFWAALVTGAAGANPVAGSGAFARPVLPAGGLHEITGLVSELSKKTLVIRLRNGRFVHVDATQALREERATTLFVSRPVRVYGHFASGVFEAWSIERARDNPAAWSADY